MDVRTPDMDGMELYRSIRGIAPEMAGLIIAGYGSMETAIEALKLGFDSFVIKPFTPHELNAAVAKALENDH